MSKEYKPQTTYQDRRRFEVIVPEHRTAEARVLVEQLDGVRLLPPDPQAKIVSQTHIAAGTISGIKIRGVVTSNDITERLVHVLADAEIVGYSRRTQVSFPDHPRTKKEKEEARKNSTNIEIVDGVLKVFHEWGDGAAIEFQVRSESRNEESAGFLEDLYKNNRFQFKILLQRIQEKLKQAADEIGLISGAHTRITSAAGKVVGERYDRRFPEKKEE